MNAYRRMAMTVTTCTAGLSLAACTAGITSASPVTSRSPATSGPASSPAVAVSHTASASASPVATVSVAGSVGSFPIPNGAQVAANMTCGKRLLIELGSVTPAHAAAFYTSALPRAGYNITQNNLASDPNTGAPQGLAELGFTGHGYTGLIIAMADLNAGASAGPSMSGLPANLSKNVVEITLTPPGASDSSAC